MAKFADTPEWKRRRVWDLEKQKFVSPAAPATAKQIRLICRLADELCMEIEFEPGTSREASRLITDLSNVMQGRRVAPSTRGRAAA